VSTLAIASVAMLCAVACLFALAGPVLRMPVSPLAQTRDMRVLDEQAGLSVESGPHRSLLSMAPDATPPPPGAAPGWAAAADAVQDVVPSAEFVCNRSSCFALRESEAEAAHQVHPFALRQEPALSREAVDMTMMSTLRELAAALEDTGPRDQDSGSVPRSPPLRGMGQMGGRTSTPPALCSPGGCSGFERLADDAMSGAGLISPGTCRLVYDSDATDAQSRELAAQQGWSARASGRRRTRSTVGSQRSTTVQAGDNGFILVEGDDTGLVSKDVGDAHGVILRTGGGAGAVGGEGRSREHKRTGGYSTRMGEEERPAPQVSVMLPVKREAAQEQGVLTPLHHLYVIVVQPERSLQAYECELAQAIYA
jgi:hypothetical protein